MTVNADESNDASLVLRLEFLDKSTMWLAADTGEKVETELLRLGKVKQTDRLKVAHHGSRTATTKPFLEVLRPSQAMYLWEKTIMGILPRKYWID